MCTGSLKQILSELILGSDILKASSVVKINHSFLTLFFCYNLTQVHLKNKVIVKQTNTDMFRFL